MKKILEFDTEIEDDKTLSFIYFNAENMLNALIDIKTMLRDYHKYEHTFKNADETIDKIYEELSEIIANNSINTLVN